MTGISWVQASASPGRGVRVGPATFEAGPGRVLGLDGSNGAGKTTLLKAACGLMALVSGQVLVNGREVRPGMMPDDVGALIEEPRFLLRASAQDNLRLVAAGRESWLRRRGSLLELVGLGERAEARVMSYSQGMRQRLGIARALLGDPGVVILDEPTNGLDPQGIRWIRDLISRLVGEGRAVVLSSHLLSSHLLSEIQVLADDVVLIADGEVLATGAKDDVLARDVTLEQFYFESLTTRAASAAAGSGERTNREA